MTSEKYPAYFLLPDRRLDDQQMKVCCSNGNTIVAAGAGSGKTHVLATRFAYLVMTENISVDKILTLTFTDKAAAEMYERIYNTLTFFALNEKTPETERLRAQKAVAGFSNARIQTLDSYCAGIVRQAANRYGIRPDFRIGASGAGRTIKNLALPFVIAHRNDVAIKSTTDAGKLQELADCLFADTVERYTSLADSETFFTDALDVQKKEIADAWNKKIPEFEKAVDFIRELFNSLPPEKKQTPYGTCLSKALEEISTVELCPVSPESIEDGSSSVMVTVFLHALKRFYFNQAQKGYTNPLRSAVGAVKNDDGIGPVFESAADYIIHYDTTKGIFKLLDGFLSKVNEAKRQTGELTFSDVTGLALRILHEQADIQRQEAESFSRIMIDEFQDNNGKNRELLSLISHNNIFFVGDEKQSVYKFRGADVSVFNKLKKEIRSSGGSVYSMIYNYRSTPELLSAFNQIFGGYLCGKKTDTESSGQLSAPTKWVFPEKPLNEYEAGFTEETIAQKYNAEKGTAEKSVAITADNVPVHVCMLNTKGVLSDDAVSDLYLNAKDQLSYFIAGKISELTAAGVKYRDIAILDRSRTDRSSLTSYLSRAGIPYTLDQHRDIFAEAPVNDIYNIMRLCVYPSDVNAFASFICSPFSGLDEQSAETVLAQSIDVEAAAPVFKPFRRELTGCMKEALPAEEFKKYEDAQKMYADVSAFLPCHRITDTISRLWYDYGYRYEFLWNRTVFLFAEQYDLLFELARQADTVGKSPAWFVDQLAQKKNSGSYFMSDNSEINAEEVTYPLEQYEAVQIMTIHKSKGLQFKYVFVCGCTGSTKSDSNKEKVYYSESSGVSLNFKNGSGNYFFKKQKAESDRKDDAEFRRLFYVGLTRAESAVYISGVWHHPKPAGGSSSMFEAIIENYYEGDRTCYKEGSPFDFTLIEPVERKVLYSSGKASAYHVSAEEKLQKAQDFALNYEKSEVIIQNVLPLNRIIPSSLETAFTGESTGILSADSYTEINEIVERTKFDYAAFGTLVHAYLQAVAGGTPPDTYIPPLNLMTGLEKETDRAVVVESCIRMVEAFNESEPGKALKKALCSGRWFRTEFAFRSFLSGCYVTGILDLAYENEDSTYTIVDYKTDKIQRPSQYYNQQALYRRALSDIKYIPQKEITCILYYLRTGTVYDITDALNGIQPETILNEIRRQKVQDNSDIIDDESFSD
ncbi:MAG: UvrD-helicase domain-containing protein [Treponema sp.]|nr:UvrD-helicase domain-containing protein [Treponema sp.]